MHKISENSVITISKDGNIKHWVIEDMEWRELHLFVDNNGTTIYSCLSNDKIFLALLKDDQKVTIYKLPNVETEQSDNLNMEPHIKHEYKQQLSSCKFSQDEKYLAIALDNGDISVSVKKVKCVFFFLKLDLYHLYILNHFVYRSSIYRQNSNWAGCACIAVSSMSCTGHPLR